MGLYTNLASGTVATGATAPGLDKSSRQQLLKKASFFDPDVTTAFAEANEVDRISQHTGTPGSGNFTLTVEAPRLGITYTTANIAYNATAATIEAALDTASPAAIGDGDIAVAEENAAGLSDGFCDFTASGALAGQPVVITITNVDFNQGDVGTVTRTTAGQTDRQAAYALFELNVISGSVWNSAEVPSLTKPDTTSQQRPRHGLIEDLARVAAWEDGTDDVYDAVLALYPQSQ